MDFSFLPTEILEKILSNLSKLDLLSCRLVSTSWNKESLRILQQSRFRQELTETTIQEYANFVQGSTNRKFILQFHLNFKGPSQMRNQIYHHDNNERILQERRWSSEFISKLAIFVQHVESLINLFGTKCIRSLQLHVKKYEINMIIALIQTLLVKLADGLESLDLFLLSDFNPSDSSNLNPAVKNHTITLPKLKKLSIYPLFFADSLIWPSFIEKCPKLEELKLGFMNKNEEVHFSDKFWPIPSSTLVQLKSLELRLCQDCKFVDKFKLRPSTYLSLQTLDLSEIRWNVATGHPDCSKIQDLLRFFSVAPLKKLKLCIFHPGDENSKGPIEVPIPFTTIFPNLEYLGLKFCSVSYVETIGSSRYFIDPVTFPKLKSIEIPHDLDLNLIPEREPFLQVTSMTITVSTTAEIFQIPEFKVENLQRIFPNVFHMSFVNKDHYEFYNSREVIKCLLNDLMCSAGAWKIQRLELHDYSENYLGQVLSQTHNKNPSGVTFETVAKINGLVVPPIKNKMTDIKFIRLLVSSEAKNRLFKGTTTNNPKELYSDAMMRNFQGLEEIQLSYLLFGNKQSREEAIIEIYRKYPDIRITVV